ncbi:MAG: TonB-dependent receptor [Colwellia sp.]|jgi:vitamin B12 transporter|nr:TonB-dependent receptor [Colwellia sp.]
MKKTLIALSILNALTITSAFAEQRSDDNVSDMETIFVTANRLSQNPVDVISSVKVITRAEIELSSADSVASLLNNIAGIQISQSGGSGQTTSIFSRGTNAGHTLVVIDGQRISSATLGVTAFADLSVEQIERIEVIKGPRAALWGSDAIGGVIQIFTRQLDAGEIAADLGFGNLGQKQLTVSGALSHGDGSTTFTASKKSSDGYDVYQNIEDDDDGYDRENFSLVGQQAINKNWKLHWLAKYDQGGSEYDSPYNSVNENSFKNKQWHLSASQHDGNWSQDLFIGQQRNESKTFGNGVLEEDANLFQTTRLQASWLGALQLTDKLSTNIGFDFIDEEVDTATAYEVIQRDIKAVFTRLAFDTNSIILDGALRYDDIEGIDSEVTYNLTAGFRFAQNSLVSLSFGSGFKAPSFNDLYYPEDSNTYFGVTYTDRGNSDLVAETSDSIELLIKSEFLAANVELNIFSTKIENLIEWLTDVNNVTSPTNISKAEINGAELTLDSAFLGLDHQIQLSYLDAKDSDTNEPLIRRAKHTASYQVSKNLDNINLLASVNYQGKREDSEWPGTVTLPSHTLVNISATYQVSTDWSLALKVNNFFDKDHVTNNKYIGQPAQYLLTVSYRK